MKSLLFEKFAKFALLLACLYELAACLVCRKNAGRLLNEEGIQ